jgi:hypothetical protein
MYGSIDSVDFYVGGLLEATEMTTKSSGSEEIGESFAAVIRDQFARLRAGDRFWYEWHDDLSTFVSSRSLQQIIEDNTQGGSITPSPFNLDVQCSEISTSRRLQLDSDFTPVDLEDSASVMDSRPRRLQLLSEYSKDTGFGNNLNNPSLGSAGTPYKSPSARSYVDGMGAMPSSLPSARLISNTIGQQFLSAKAVSTHSVAMLVWGQLIAHDVGDLGGNSSDPAPIPVPLCDSRFDPQCAGNREIPFSRGNYVLQDGARHQVDGVSHFIDASWLYGGPNMQREFVGGRLLLPNNSFPPQAPAHAVDKSKCTRPLVADMRAPDN